MKNIALCKVTEMLFPKTTPTKLIQHGEAELVPLVSTLTPHTYVVVVF